MSALLEVEAIHTYYGDSYVLQGLSLEVPAGGVTALMGRNGVGKTTLLRSIVGFTPASRGRIVFDGQDITRLAAHRIRRLGIGLVPQGRRVFRELTVLENLQIAVRPGPGWSLDTALDFFPRLRERLSHPGGKLSGGEQQMLASVRPLVAPTRLLLLDEASEGLSPLLVRELGALIARLKSDGQTLLMVEQNLDFVAQFADHVYIMDHGVVVWQGVPQALAADEQAKSTYLGL